MYVEELLATVVSWCAAIGAIVMVIFLIKDILGLLQGSVSMGKVVGKVLCVLIIMGVMFAALNFEDFGEMFGNVFEKVVTDENLPDVGQK